MGLLRTTLSYIGIVLAWSLVLSAGPILAEDGSLRPWDGAPQLDVPLQDSEGKTVALADDKAPILILHFFATSCDACREELPALEKLAERSREELAIYAISVAEPEVRIRRFLQKMPLSFPVLLDRDRRMAKAWKAASLPTTFVLDRKGHGLFIEESFKWDRLDLVSLRRMLAQSEKRKSASAISSDVK